jgi:hypothetical protein
MGFSAIYFVQPISDRCGNLRRKSPKGLAKQNQRKIEIESSDKFCIRRLRCFKDAALIS